MDARRRCMYNAIRDLAAATPDGIARIDGYDRLRDTCGISNPDNARRVVEGMTRDGLIIRHRIRQFIPVDPDPERVEKLDYAVAWTGLDRALVARAAFMMQRGWSSERVCGALGREINLDCNVIHLIRGALGHAGYLRVG